jgi:hypothetical protein
MNDMTEPEITPSTIPLSEYFLAPKESAGFLSNLRGKNSQKGHGLAIVSATGQWVTQSLGKHETAGVLDIIRSQIIIHKLESFDQ